VSLKSATLVKSSALSSSESNEDDQSATASAASDSSHDDESSEESDEVEEADEAIDAEIAAQLCESSASSCPTSTAHIHEFEYVHSFSDAELKRLTYEFGNLIN
jgi:hypothetical protein